MRNLTFRERAIVVGVILTFLVGSAHRYWKAKSSSAAAGSEPESFVSDAKR